MLADALGQPLGDDSQQLTGNGIRVDTQIIQALQ